MYILNWFDFVIFGVAGALGLGATFFFWVLFGITKSITKERMIGALLIGVGVIPAMTAILSPRELGFGQGIQYIVSATSQSAGIASWVNRLVSLALVSLALAMTLRGLIENCKFRRGGEALWFSYVAMFLLGICVSSFAGTKPSFFHTMFYAPLVMTAVYMNSSVSPEWLAFWAKKILLIYLYGTLIAAAIVPDWAIEGAYHSVIPGLNSRLVGLAGHSNGLGALALLFLLLELYFPSRNLWRLLNLTAALAVLVAAQSKTVWIAAIVCIVIAVACQMFHQPESRLAYKEPFRKNLLAISGFAALMGSLSALLILMYDQSINFGEFSESGVGTFTGRARIWEITLDAWRANPIFGYGPRLWDFEFRTQYDALAVGNAHNQFIETLGNSGILGFAGMIVYFFTLILTSLRHLRVTRGLSLALVAVLVVRSFAETPLSSLSIVDTTFFMHLLVFAYLQTLDKQFNAVMR